VSLDLSCGDYAVVVCNEPPHKCPGGHAASHQVAGDGLSAVEVFWLGDREVRSSSRHCVTVSRDGKPIASRMLIASGGATVVHAHSAFVRDDRCFVAIGPYVCSLQIPSLEPIWTTQADEASCFGVYHAPQYEGIVSHGELSIARLSYDGDVVWSAGGADIFTNGFALQEHHAEAIDFEGRRYRFLLTSGACQGT
jgi:hypothetical protein